MINLRATASSFEKLNILKEYVDVLTDANKPFNKDYEPIIEYVIADLGFPQKLIDPIETIIAMRDANHVWNHKLSELAISRAQIEDTNQIKKDYKNFRKHCPIEWYRKYAEDAINKRKGN
ncbi:hypothetical protein [Cyclobacterium plantarum]|uniref:hypothetical protein n=1 Tax=Cyclobacterium plantarum TaxID=2716263 RepID=UPI003F6F5CA6